MHDHWGQGDDLGYVDPDYEIWSQRAVIYGVPPESLDEKELVLIPGKLSLKKIASKIINDDLSYMTNKITETECIVLDLNEIYGKDIDSEVNLLYLVLFSLRILKTGFFSFGPIITYGQDKNSYSYTNHNSRPSFRNTKKLDKKDKLELITIINGVHNLEPENTSFLRISFTRFSRYFSNRHREDKLIDLCIAFESLFIKGEEKKSRLPMGEYIGELCSNLLEETEDEKEIAVDQIRTCFRMRNIIVHGGEVKEYDLMEILPRFENYYRQSIMKLI